MRVNNNGRNSKKTREDESFSLLKAFQEGNNLLLQAIIKGNKEIISAINNGNQKIINSLNQGNQKIINVIRESINSSNQRNDQIITSLNEISTDINQLSQTVRNGNELILESISSGNNRLFDAFEYNIKNRSNRSISLHKLNSEISETIMKMLLIL